MAETARTSMRATAAKLAEHGISAAESYDRPDLAERLQAVHRLTTEPTVRVLVAGEFKQGKSSLVNALVGKDVCPVDDDIATAVATAVRYAESPEAVAVVADDDGSTTREDVDPSALPAWITEDGELSATEGLRMVEVGVPAEILRGGLVLVDLPGAGGLGSFHGAATLAALRYAQAAVFASDAVQELTAPERDFLVAVADRCPTIALVKTRTDIHPSWRRIMEADQGHAADIVTKVVGVSSELAARGRAKDDAELLEESGIPALGTWLHDDVLTGAGRRLALSVVEEVTDVAAQLRSVFEAEQAALAEGADQAELEAQLEKARADAERLRAAASKWQQILSDSFTDINADTDHDLRGRVRTLVRSAEDAIDQFDPADGWEEYEPALRREVATLVADHYAGLSARVEEAVEKVSAVFEGAALDLDELMRSVTHAPASELDPADGAAATIPEAKQLGRAGQALMVVRGGYGSALMLGFLGTAVGLTIAAPALLAVGIIAGGKGLKAEKERQINMRRTQAKAAARKFVDDVVFQVSKESRAEVQRSQRALRDHFSARAGELVRSADDALAAAKQAAGVDANAREGRRNDVAAELERIDWLTTTAAGVRDAVAKAAQA